MRRSRQDSSRLRARDEWRKLIIDGKGKVSLPARFVTAWHGKLGSCGCCCSTDYYSVVRRAVRVAVTPMMMLQRSTERAWGEKAERETRELDLHVIMKEREKAGAKKTPRL